MQPRPHLCVRARASAAALRRHAAPPPPRQPNATARADITPRERARVPPFEKSREAAAVTAAVTAAALFTVSRDQTLPLTGLFLGRSFLRGLPPPPSASGSLNLTLLDPRVVCLSVVVPMASIAAASALIRFVLRSLQEL